MSSDTMEPETVGSPSCTGRLRHLQYMSPTLRRLQMSTSGQHQFVNTKPLTPRNQSPFSTPNALHRKSVSRFHIFHPVNNTPPSRFPMKVQNPFEAALVDRLHLPLIGSPSLFQLPSTPQHSSTQFEWTIDEVSSLNPTNVEAHETQFISTIDPEQEAKAQEVITNYFKEKISVPSPVDCPLRNQKIILPSQKPAARPKRCSTAQTDLTFPPILPPELEEILRPFCTFTQDQQQTPTKETAIGANSSAIDHEARDASLRRKLFNASLNTTESDDRDFQLHLDECLSPAPTSPEVVRSGAARSGFQSPNNERRSFNLSLSPVRSGTDGHCSSFGSISPITRTAQSPSLTTVSPKRICTNSSSIYQSTPGSSPPTIGFQTCQSIESTVQMSIDCSTHSRIHRTLSHPIRNLSKSYGSDLSAMLMDDDDHEDEDDENVAPNSRSTSSLSGSDMIIVGSPRGTRSSNSNTPDSQHSGTPSRKLRRATRKNLSHSFSSSQFLSDESMAEQEALSQHPSMPPMNKDCLAELVDQPKATVPPLSQTDSGFNEMEE